MAPGSDLLHRHRHNRKTEDRDWVRYHSDYLEMWENRLERTVRFQIGFIEENWPRYMAWFNHEGMRTVYWRGTTAENVNYPVDLNAPRPEPGMHKPFTMRAEVVQRQVILSFLSFLILEQFNFTNH